MLLGRTPQEADANAVEATGLDHQIYLTQPTAPLFLLVHGRAGNRRVMWTFSPAVPMVANIITPEAFLDDPHDGGRSWWTKDDFNPATIDRARDRLTKFLDASLQHYDLRPERIVAFGFSQGGALLSVLMQERPSLFAGLALLASFVIERPVVSADGERSPVFIAHGERDRVLSVSLAEQGRNFLQAAGHDVEFHLDDVEHKVGREGMRALKPWAARMIS